MARDPMISDPVVAVAMEDITVLIGGAHQHDIHLADVRDRATAIEALESFYPLIWGFRRCPIVDAYDSEFPVRGTPVVAHAY